ncbi:MAG TPA: response regulator transcription factor [Nitriliruptorales bacterium]|nr:response regulator transcription factor [Nitriliruptorales bacterium]
MGVLNLEYLVEQGVRAVLGDAGVDVVVLGLDLDDLIGQIERSAVDAVLVALPSAPTFAGDPRKLIRSVRRSLPHLGVVVLARQLRREEALDLLQGGPGGIAYLQVSALRPDPDLAGVVEQVVAGHTVVDPTMMGRLLEEPSPQPDPTLEELTPRERQVMQLMATGRTNEAIARELGISRRGVEKYVSHIFAWLQLDHEPDLNRRVTAVIRYLQRAAR